MSLFGSGRREGVVAVLLLGALALGVHALGALTGLGDVCEGDQTLAAGMATAHAMLKSGELPLWDPLGAGAPLWSRGAELLYPPWWLLGRGDDARWLPLLAALHAALACGLCFRFLRAQGRSRYAAFVTGPAYGLGAHAGSLGGHLAEFAALAWAPLPIEVFLRVARTERNRHWAPLLGPALAIPFLTGGTVTAGCVATIVAGWLLRRALQQPLRRAGLLRTGFGSGAVLLLLTTPLWLCAAETPREPVPPLPMAAVLPGLLRVTGPLLSFLAVLGLMRVQRHSPAERWLPVAIGGAGFAVLMPSVPSPFAGPAPWHEAPAALWWPTHLALVLLAASGLDDFLDLPMRRRPATRWLLAISGVVAPCGFLLDRFDTRFHVEAAVLFAIAALFAGWRWLGILGFKTVLAVAAMVWLALSTLQEMAGATRVSAAVAGAADAGTGMAPPAPLVETRPPLRPPPRARLAFVLRAGAGVAAPVPLPRPQTATAIAGLPADFTPRADATARVQPLREGATFADYQVELGAGQGALVVTDTYTRGWRATVDGRPVPIYRADDQARAVLLPPGAHRVAFRYQPMAWALGPWFAAAGLAIGLAWWIVAGTARLAAVYRRAG